MNRIITIFYRLGLVWLWIFGIGSIGVLLIQTKEVEVGLAEYFGLSMNPKGEKVIVFLVLLLLTLGATELWKWIMMINEDKKTDDDGEFYP